MKPEREHMGQQIGGFQEAERPSELEVTGQVQHFLECYLGNIGLGGCWGEENLCLCK